MERENPDLPAGRGAAPVRMINHRRDASRRLRAAGGFTLLEVVLVIGLLAILAGFAWPAMSVMFRKSQLPESADQFKSLLGLTRAQAMLDNRRYRIRFAPKERFPVIESEPDPFTAVGKYEAVKADWTADERLLGDAQVHEIRLGRPEYTLPFDDEKAGIDVSAPGDDASATSDGIVDAESDGTQTEPTFTPEMTSDEPVDEKRPTIVFEPDGSTNWATIILANKSPDAVLADDEEQIWIEMDGRSGLAAIRPSMTEAMMADESLRIPRTKLKPPELAFGDLALSGETGGGTQKMGGSNTAGTPFSLEGGVDPTKFGGSSGLPSGLSSLSGLLPGAGDGSSPPPPDGKQRPSRDSGKRPPKDDSTTDGSADSGDKPSENDSTTDGSKDPSPADTEENTEKPDSTTQPAESE